MIIDGPFSSNVRDKMFRRIKTVRRDTKQYHGPMALALSVGTISSIIWPEYLVVALVAIVNLIINIAWLMEEP